MSWPMVKLGSVGEFKAGFGFPVEYQGKKEGDYPFAKVGDISAVVRSGHKNIFHAGNYIDKDILGNLKAKTIPKGTIVFAKIGEAIKQNFRAVTTVEMVIDNNVMGLVPDNNLVDTNYLFYFMRSLDLYQFSGATTIPALRKSMLENIQIPLPPLSEQKRIAAILDKADSIRQKREQAIKLADDFLRSTFLAMFGDPVGNPKEWKKDKIKKGVLDIASGWSATGENTPCKSDEFGVLKISSVTSGIFKPEENKIVHYESIPASKKLIHPKKGDLLFSRANTRELVAAICMVHQNYDNLFLPDKLWTIKLNHELLLPEFFLILIQNEKVRELLTKQATGTSGSMLNISKNKFEETEIIFPEINVQKDFCNAFRKTINLKAKLIKSNELANESFNSLSQKVFLQ
ncbi:restriction endonuclease subunit S [Proteus mirabilis]|uniref:restriction endonuclease subunit S n=1 Tax=Proteus mirabilis TaxID=584 RepID=UPI0025548864|nr:restriction endonuclease subunit S [Proteus mirabilis]MDL2100770.1 restriction endonuclease subunit S [Proteus mirabilis]